MEKTQSIMDEIRMGLQELRAEIEKKEGKIKLEMKSEVEIIFYSLNKLERLFWKNSSERKRKGKNEKWTLRRRKKKTQCKKF